MRKLANLPGWWMMNRNAHMRRRAAGINAPDAPTVSGTWVTNNGEDVVGVTLPCLPFRAMSFRVERQTNGQGAWVDVSGDFGDRGSWSYAEFSSESEVAYRWRCIAVGAHSESAPGPASEKVGFAPPIEVVQAPGLSAEHIDPADETGIVVSVGDLPEGASYMRLERRWEGGDWQDVSNRLEDGVYQQAGTEPGAEGIYEWQIVAGNAGGEKGGDTVAASVFDANATLEAPKPDVDPTALDGDGSSTTAVTFGLPAEATGWWLQQSADEENWEQVATGDASNCQADCSYDNRGGESSAFVQYRVKWSDRFGRESDYGAASDAVEFYPADPPPGPGKPGAPTATPTEVPANGESYATVTLPGLPDGAVRFRVERTSDGENWEDCTGDFGAEPVSGASMQSTYGEEIYFSWHCIAVDSDGNESEPSDPSDTVHYYPEE